jgi:hypothetical protein
MRGRRRGCLLLVLVGAAVCPGRAMAYTLASGFSQSCHERLTLAALGVLVQQLGAGQAAVPADDLWRQVAAALAQAVLETTGAQAAAGLSEQQLFVLFSAVVGVRAPDTGGHSVSNLDQLRVAQVNPDPRSQYVHCLRGPADDGAAGDLATLTGAEQLIRQEVAAAATSAGRSGAARNTGAPFYLDFYGQLTVEVDEPAFRIGRALHTLQDSYAHTLRSGDGRNVYSVLNYIDPVSGRLDPPRDGMAHSDALDDCRRAELAPLVTRAAAVSLALARAAVALARDGDSAPLDRGFAACPAGETDVTRCEWLRHVPGCAQDNDYCASPWLDIAREKLTEPYVKAVLGCQAAPGGLPVGAPGVVLVAVAVGLVMPGMRKRRRSKAALLALGAALSAPAARAEQAPPAAVFVTVEGHLSLLSATPERSFIDASFGYALRGGYRTGPWGWLLQAERNYWMPTELGNDVQAGALNLGVGVERLLLGGFVRVSAVAGPSILWFDAALDDKGSVGVFVDLRPAGLRWRVTRHLALALDPLSLAIVSPVLGSPGIRQIEHRTLAGVEVLP